MSLYNERQRLCTLSCTDPLELSWQLVRWAVTPAGTMEFGQTCKPSPHQTPAFCLWEFNNRWVISCCWTVTTVDSMRPFILFASSFSRCTRMMMEIPLFRIARVFQTSVCYWLFVEAKNSNIIAHTHTYSCQSLHFTYSIQPRVRHPHRTQMSSKSKHTILKYWAILWFIPYYWIPKGICRLII